MITEHKILSYTIESHPDPDKVYDWIRDNWHDLGQFDVDEFVDSFKALANHFQACCDYSVSLVPSRGEFLKLIGTFTQEQIDELNADDLPLTGVCWDYGLIKALQNADLEDFRTYDGLNIIIDISEALFDLHNQGEYLYSDDGLRKLCEANEYQFLANGEFYL
jgi:hypothetical protein